MKNRILSVCGALAPILYVMTVALAGAIRPGYSHIAQAVSELIETGAPNKALLDALFIIYNLLVGLFGFRILFWTSHESHTMNRAAAWTLIVTAFLGLLMPLSFPMDPRGTPVSFVGTMHLVLAGLTSLGTMLAILFTGLWLRKQPELGNYAMYSFISLAVVFVSGGIAAASAAQVSPFMGLFERITIGAFLQWLFVLALKTLQTKDQA